MANDWPADVLAQLQGTSFRGIGFPSLMVDAVGGHNTVTHPRQDRDVGRTENTGRKGYLFSLKIPFFNTLAAAPQETWASGALFPGVYRQVIAALEDRSTGAFVHPTYGKRTCKVLDWHDPIEATVRGGPVVTVQLEETDDALDPVAIASAAPLPVAGSAAVILDAWAQTLTPSPYFGTPDGQSLGDFLKSISAIGDQVQLAENQVLGKIGAVINALNNVADAFNPSNFTDGLTIPDALQRMISALHAVAATSGAQAQKTIAYYVVPQDSTLAQVAARVGAKVADLLALNPALARRLTVPATTAVACYG